jgi:hypothetical protein
VTQVARDQVEEPPGGEQGERALEGFEDRHCTQGLFQAALQR